MKGRKKNYQAVQPPSTTKFEPVMYDEASDARNKNCANIFIFSSHSSQHSFCKNNFL